MKNLKRISIFSGILFLSAMFGSLSGGFLLESVLPAYENSFLFLGSSGKIKLGVFLEMVNVISVMGIAIILYPVLKSYNETLAWGYFTFRFTEALACLASSLVPIIMLRLAEQPLSSFTMGNAGNFLLQFRALMNNPVILMFFCLGALILYSIILSKAFLPAYIAYWGFAGIISLVVMNLLKTETQLDYLFALPIISNEIYLGFWLIIRGFRDKP